MRVSVRCYGIVADAMHAKARTVDLPDGATVGALFATLAAEQPGFAAVATQVRAVVGGQPAGKEAVLADGAEIGLMRAIGGGEPREGAKLVHAELPIVPSPSGLPSQHIVTSAVGATATFLGQQWLQPGERVRLHTHPCEEAVMFLSGTGEATLGERTVAIGPATSLFFPAGLVHGFRNTGDETMHVIIVFPVPHFAETTIVD